MLCYLSRVDELRHEAGELLPGGSECPFYVVKFGCRRICGMLIRQFHILLNFQGYRGMYWHPMLLLMSVRQDLCLNKLSCLCHTCRCLGHLFSKSSLSSFLLCGSLN